MKQNKNFLQFLTLSILLVITTFSVFVGIGGKILSPAPANAQEYGLATSEEDQNEENEQTDYEGAGSESATFSTPFFIDIEAVAIIKNGEDQETLVYDRYDGLIKILDKENNFKTENPVFKPNLSSVTDIFVTDTYILLYDGNMCQFEAYDYSYSLLPFDFSTLTTLQSAKFIDLVTIDDLDYIFISSAAEDNSFTLAKLSLTEGSSEKTLVLDTPLSFSVHELYTSISSYDTIYLTEKDNRLLVMLISTSGVLSFEISPDEVNNFVVTTTTSVLGLEEQKAVIYAKNIALTDRNVVAVQTADGVSFYSLTLSPDVVFTKLSSASSEISSIDLSDQEATDVFAYEDKIAIIFNESQILNLYTISGTSDNFAIALASKTNPEVLITDLDVDDFSYYKVNADTILVNSPYSRTKIVDIVENSNIVKIATASSDGEALVGWTYVLCSTNDQNFYGFVESSLLTTLDAENIDAYESYVLNYTVLRKYPSLIGDGKNANLLTIPTNAKVRVLSNNYGYASLGANYLLVEVNGQKGFIDVSRIRQNSDDKQKIITNAVVTHDNSEIFAEADNQSDIITYLSSGIRVKVIGKRDTINNLTHVTFNDEYGNEIEGYIYTSNLKTDTWSMLQIIGMLLVVLNMIFLVVIVVIKNKLAK